MCMARNCAQIMQLQAMGSNPLSGSITCQSVRPFVWPSVRPSAVHRTFCSVYIFINASWHSVPPNYKLIQIKNHKESRGRPYGQTDRWTGILYFRSGYLKPCPAAACNARNYGPRAFISKIRWGQLYVQRYGSINLTGPHWGINFQFGGKVCRDSFIILI